MKKDLIIKQEFLSVNFDENVKTSTVDNKTIYEYPRFNFSITNYNNHDILKLNNYSFFYHRIEGIRPSNEAVFKKIQRDLKVLSKINDYNYMVGLESIFHDVNEYKFVKIKAMDNGFVLKPVTDLKAENIKTLNTSHNNIIGLSKKSKINLFLNVEQLDPNNTLEEEDDIKAKLLKHGYVFSRDLFMPLQGEEIENPFFDFTNHKELTLIEKIHYLIK